MAFRHWRLLEYSNGCLLQKDVVREASVPKDGSSGAKPLSRTMIRSLVLLPIAFLILLGLFIVMRPDPPASNSAPEPGSAADERSNATFDLAVREGVMIPDEVEVEEGDHVTLSLTSEEPLEVHIHGYDLEREVAPGKPATLSFEADLTGRFEIENHESEEVLGVLLVQPD
jgi:heme/copper-type cytochrome/quinol oxidase subunit 2